MACDLPAPGFESGEQRRRGFRNGARAMLPLVPAAAAFGVSFGVLAGAAGVGWLAATVMSATTFAGSAQVAVVSILGAGGGLAAAVAAALLLNARYAAISVAIGPSFRGPLWRRLVEAQLIVDESWAVSVSRDGGVEPGVLVGAGATLWTFWTGGTVQSCARLSRWLPINHSDASDVVDQRAPPTAPHEFVPLP